MKGLDLKPLDRVQPVQQQLTVYMIAARNLKAMDLNGTSDPYMTLEVAETRSGGAKEGFWVGKVISERGQGENSSEKEHSESDLAR